MKHYIACVFVISFAFSNLYAQSNFEKFKLLSAPKKTWVFFHVFKAKKALLISEETNRIADSIKNTKLLDGDPAGGQVDAFRHSYWMARLRQEIGKSAARSLGKRHEKENFLMYKARKLEEGILPDECSKKMDLYNNEIGLSLTKKRGEISKNELIKKIALAITEGKMKVIKKDKAGNFLTCEGKILTTDDLKGKWINDKCLVPSNYKPI